MINLYHSLGKFSRRQTDYYVSFYLSQKKDFDIACKLLEVSKLIF